MIGHFVAAVVVAVAIISLLSQVDGHGRLLDPPGRSSLWRFVKDAPVNYNDNELFCGGFSIQHTKYGGRCGVCGDSWGAGSGGKYPRPNEAGGKYGRGVIVKQYRPGQIIDVLIELTKNHRGHFEFKICPTNSKTKRATDQCLNKYRIPLADGSGFRYPITTARNGFYNIKLRLPDGLKCSRCVLQWRYRNGNNWGICPDGNGRKGCGNQEEFRGCADVRISNSATGQPIVDLSKTEESKMTVGGGGGSGGIVFVKKKKPAAKIVRACEPLVQSTTQKRYQQTFEWCKQNCITSKPNPVCSQLCRCV
ncbi:Uncharacterised protein g1196 [Pycnogonum litorale]